MMHFFARQLFPGRATILPAAPLLVSLLLSGCNERLVVQQLESSHQLIPLAVGNRWTYVDSITTGDIIQVDTITVVVESVSVRGAYTWWKLRNAFNPSIASREFTLRNDSIYSLQYTRSPGGPAPIVSLEYVRPPSLDTVIYKSLFGGDVSLMKSAAYLRNPVTVKAGIFLGCISYDYSIYPERYHEVLVPGLGVVSCEIVAPSSVYDQGWRRSIWLIDYRLPIPHPL